ncbi:MAG: tRNA threonylcarbamoyladenosine dehydratase [Clostridia bacterium]|nr:tRNA threonylcarbamoyladenosine dehydratase [Clostridia bacterium]
MKSQFVRTAMLIGEKKIEILSAKTVAVFGLGGVGGNVVDALARTGVGHFVLVDADRVAPSNINRQLIATWDTVGEDKVDAMARHVTAVNPSATVEKRKTFYLPENAGEFDFAAYDYVVDAIDTVSAKIDLAVRCQAAGTPLISAMGCGNKLDPTKLTVADLYDTHTDPLAKVMRRELKRRGVTKLKVVYSTEPAATPLFAPEEGAPARRATPASTVFVPPVAGIVIAREVVMDLLGR